MPPLRRAVPTLVALVSAVSIAAVEPSPPPVVGADAPAASTQARAAGPISSVRLSDGQVLRGRVVQQTAEEVVLELVSGGRMTLARKGISAIEVEDRAMVSSTGQIWFKDPNRTRYFYSPSAMTLKQGEGYFSQKELFFSAVAYGITDNITVLIGSVLPMWMSGTVYGINLIGAIKVGFSPAEDIHVAAGFESIALPGLSLGGGFLFAGITVGDDNAHVTINAGAPFFFVQDPSAEFGDAIVTTSGNYRLGRHVALVTEHWFLPQFNGGLDLTMINSLGARIFGEQWAVDLGFVRLAPAGMASIGFIPIPWVDFTYNFG